MELKIQCRWSEWEIAYIEIERWETERAMVSHTDTHKSSLSRSLGWWFCEKRDWNVKECEWQRERERGIVVFIGGGVCSMCLLSVICLFMAVLTKVLFSISICELNLK